MILLKNGEISLNGLSSPMKRRHPTLNGVDRVTSVATDVTGARETKDRRFLEVSYDAIFLSDIIMSPEKITWKFK